jgi:uncharacterized membrane protein YphA (DoxX/SURF4 family)
MLDLGSNPWMATTAIVVILLTAALALLSLEYRGILFIRWMGRNGTPLIAAGALVALPAAGVVTVASLVASAAIALTAGLVIVLSAALLALYLGYRRSDLLPWLSGLMRPSKGASRPISSELIASTRRTASSLEVLRIGLGVVWAANLLFILLPSSDYWGSFASVAASFGSTTPGGSGFAQFVSSYPTVFAGLIALVTAYLAVAFLAGFTTRLACLVGFFASSVFLWTQWGSTFSFPGGTDVGAQPLYLVMYVVVFVGGAGRFWAVDGWIWRTGRAWLASAARWVATLPPTPIVH